MSACAQGVRFESGPWKDVLALAAKEHKLVYMDVYTTWCGPCKIMSSTIFPEKAAGDRYNAAFVNYKVDAERGEGMELAATYKVDGYPTNLFIDPVSREVVYRVTGSADLPGFLQRADIALAEQKDPMKWSDYEQQFEKGNRDKAFLVSFAEKAERLEKGNDRILDAYIQEYVKGKPDEAALKFLSQYTHTFDNKAVALIFANEDRVKALYPGDKDRFRWWGRALQRGTFDKAVAGKNEQLLEVLESSSAHYGIPIDVISGIHYYRKDFYRQTGNEAMARKAAIDEAAYLMGLKPEFYARKDEEGLRDARESILYQLKAMKTPEEQYESSIKATLEKNPDMKRPASLFAAQILNESAWAAAEDKGADKEYLKLATEWSAKSLELARGSKDWALYADTYANLLYYSGDKQKALSLQDEAVKQAEAAGSESLDSLRETRARMQAGKM